MAITKPTLTRSEQMVYELFCDNLSAEEISKRVRIPYFAIIEARYNIIKKGYELPELKEEQFR